MANIKLWLRAVRPFAYPASIVPVLLGTMLAVNDGFFKLGLFLLSLAGGLLLHTGTNLINDYFDYANGIDTPDSYGSSGVLVASLMEPKRILVGGLVALSLVVPIAIVLFIARGPMLLVLGAFGLVGGYFYTAKPIAYKYRGLGVPLVFLLMGPLMVGGSYFVQTGTFSVLVLFASLPVGCLVGAILHANEYRDIDQDRLHGIISPSIILGRQKARFLYYLLVGGAYLIVITMALSGSLSMWALLTLVTVPFALKPIRVIEVSAHGKDSPQLPLVDVLTAQLHLQFGLLLIFGVTLGRLI
jgi:1,4-dihydroxy-2-naphthoate polyprenyltransferase